MLTTSSRLQGWSRITLKPTLIALCTAATSVVYVHSAYSVVPAEMVADIQGQAACSSAQTFSTVVTSGLPSGDVYVRLANKDERQGSVALYYQPLTATSCVRLGTVAPNSTTWTKITAHVSSSGQGGYLTITGKALDAGPYQAVADVLVVQDSVCRPTTSCQVTYHGQNGTLQPQQISGATDQIAVFVAKPVAGVTFTNVQYYSDADYLYRSSVIAPIATNYLSGGKHQTQTVIQLANGEKIEIDKTVDMGTDYSGMLWLRSTFYRSSGAARIIFILAGVIIASAVVLTVARLWIDVRRWRRKHGLSGYKMKYAKPKSNIKVG